MDNQNTPGKSLRNQHSKDKRLAELEKVKKALFEKPQTMKELDISIRVMRESICWKRTLNTVPSSLGAPMKPLSRRSRAAQARTV